MRFDRNIFKGQTKDLGAIFIAAPRELSTTRFVQIVKHYLPKGHIVLGISDEPYVMGYEDQPQFKMLEYATVAPIVDKIASSDSPYKVFILEYSQSELPAVLARGGFKRVLLVNGSWKYAFHNLEAYDVLIKRGIPFKFISPFVDEAEAHEYEKTHTPDISFPEQGAVLDEAQMTEAAELAAKQSFDNSFQTGAALGRKITDGYAFVATSFNKVIPYQTYALHHGNSREKHRARPHDTNHYDTIHAEMQMLTQALTDKIDLAGTTLFVNLLPCPNCARTLSQTAIAEVVYRHDHSDGYAVELLKACGKKVRKLDV